MYKLFLVFLSLWATVSLQAQNYYIDFTASGTTTTLDSVFVQNLTQSTSLTLGGSDTLHLIGTVNITNKNQNSNNIRIYPNPFNEKSYVEFYNETQAMIAVDIYDVVGKNVLSLRQELESGLHIFEMTGFSTGHYQLIVKTDTWQKTAAFVSLQTNNQNPQLQFKSTLSKETHTNTTTRNSSKNMVQMFYTTNDQMRFTGFSGGLSIIVNDTPTYSKTIDFVFTGFICGTTFTDSRDGNIYTTVQIGNQCWMAKNLAFLPNVVGAGIGSQTIPYYYVYGYNGTDTIAAKATTNYITYGVLYNWAAAMAGATSSSSNPSGVQGVCPTGWHLPSDAEWSELTTFLGGESIAGGKLKETGTTHWYSPNTGATNETGFTALPGGHHDLSEEFDALKQYGSWWSATESSSNSAWNRNMGYIFENVFGNYYFKDTAYSIRCIKD